VRFEFVELPMERAPLVRPAIPVQLEDLAEAPQLCLVDTGATTNRFGSWLAEAVGIDLSGAAEDDLVIAGTRCRAIHARADLTIAGTRYDAPVTFCDPWPFGFNLLGQEGFLRFFRVTICAAETWLDVTWEEAL
jgi:hypothetical protein